MVLGLTIGILVMSQVCVLVAADGENWIPFTLPALASVYAGAGLVAWHRRPRNGMGLLLVMGALANILVGFGNSEIRPLQVVGAVFSTVPLALIIHLLLAFPSGRLHGAASRVIVLGAYVNSVFLQAPSYLLAGPPDGLLDGPGRPDVIAAARLAQRLLGLVVEIAAAVILSQRLLAITPRQRRVFAPLALYGVVTVFTIPLSRYIVDALALDPVTVFLVQLVALAGIPVAFAVCVLRGGFEPTYEVDDLALWLGSDAPGSGRPRMARALAATLGDPTLRVTFDEAPLSAPGSANESANESDAESAADPAAEPAPEDGVVQVDLDGRRVAQITYDPALITDRRQVDAAARVLAIALDRERLTDELQVRGDELRQSRVRLLEAQDRERRRIVRDLHDGLQSQLVLLSWRAARLAKSVLDGEAAVEARGLHDDLDQVSGEVRRLIHGLMPALLTEQGLFAAVEDLSEALPVRGRVVRRGSDQGLPGAVETTLYFVVAESLTNVVKHAQAQSVDIMLERHDDRVKISVADDGVGGATPDVVTRGTGLRGLIDRVDALGGTLSLASPERGGTKVLVEIPCAP
ncbi:histidine kinase/DNA gyrase B/HSP90-like ATPase [Humibacillus xanthopallidus]|uniref:histidine kinase n=1 Tax=Humibacillus xanthopallidus TaxID=412689 RepID=A0A543I383_9MICO|nr:histidine kinase/DNA gyrase B/HSP90-like ATPase [Humibacillus xanthopallidus]